MRHVTSSQVLALRRHCSCAASTTASAAASGVPPSRVSASCATSTTRSSLRKSQIPSDPNTTNRSSLSTSYVVTSGLDTIPTSCPSVSPNEREHDSPGVHANLRKRRSGPSRSPPSTTIRSTRPLLARMRMRSSGSPGLWSRVSRTARRLGSAPVIGPRATSFTGAAAAPLALSRSPRRPPPSFTPTPRFGLSPPSSSRISSSSPSLSSDSLSPGTYARATTHALSPAHATESCPAEMHARRAVVPLRLSPRCVVRLSSPSTAAKMREKTASGSAATLAPSRVTASAMRSRTRVET
mmetsp:Transcript_742/g.2697  ORF Transcript_742/g.2697 Transcript_742/m.2697 type:complete len:296 (-) Transcript_742:523-1410(-)